LSSWGCAAARAYFFFQAEDGIRARNVTGVQTCALPICDLPCEGTLLSDCRPLHRLSAAALAAGGVRMLRDPTRGGIATTLNEFEIGRASCRERAGGRRGGGAGGREGGATAEEGRDRWPR